MNLKAKEILNKITLEDKARLCSGKNFWELESVLDLPNIMVTDGPHGLRKQVADADHIGISQSVEATCFPTAVGLASSWDDNLIYKVGEHLADECLTENVSVLLGPGANIKRHPLCGRNFEYFSEDPFLSGHLAKNFINGVQSKGVGTSLKHFVANNQETMRMAVDTFIDERTLREIYLKGFEIAVKEAQPWTVMCSYNKIDGKYLSEHKKFLDDILKQEWKHDGLVVTDWGACNDRVEGILAGQDLEMPGGTDYNANQIVQAVENGILPVEILDARVERVIDLILKSLPALEKKHNPYDKEIHHQFAREVAADTMVLLKNENNILPLNESQSVALIGEFAKRPRYQGSGSSLINPTKVSNAYDAFKENIGDLVSYAQGYISKKDELKQDLIDEAVAIAKEKDVVVLMIGLTDLFESEGFDRDHLRIPNNHIVLLEALAKVNENIVVCLSNGSPISMSWSESAMAILEQYLGGQASGEALVDVLYGKVNPSGKLAETFPNHENEFPSSQNFPGLPRQVEYREGLFVGYRYYDTVNVNPLYPFGYGLSYTSFAYSDITVEQEDEITITFHLENIGDVDGKEVAQIYVSKKESNVYRPIHELKGFKKVFIRAGEKKQVTVNLTKSDLQIYQDGWKLEKGKYIIQVGSSSKDIHLEKEITILGENVKEDNFKLHKEITENSIFTKEQFEEMLGYKVPSYPALRPFTMNSVIGELQSSFIGRKLRNTLKKQLSTTISEDADETMLYMIERMTDELPLRKLVMLSSGELSVRKAEGILDLMNYKVFRGLWKLITG